MASTVLKLNEFGGLNLRDDPLEIGAAGAVNLSNVLVDRRGTVRTRWGMSQLTNAVTNANYLLRWRSGGTDQIILADTDGGHVYVRDSSTGASVTSSAITVYGIAAAGGSSPAVYMPSNLGLYKWTGSGSITLAVTTAQAKGTLAAMWQNRLVISKTSAGIDLSRVQFSDPGAPETLGVNNWVDLNPGDGDYIRELVAWRDYLFVFKRDRFFVFYDTGIDSGGNPIFNYRQVAAGVGAWLADFSSAQVCAAPDAVYFVGQDGVYRTDGNAVMKVSGVLDPYFMDETTVFTTAAKKSITYARGKIYVALNTAATFVFDIATQTWTVYAFQMSYAADFSVGGAQCALLVTTTGVHIHGEPYTDDNGTPIAWSYKTGCYEPAGGNEATVPETSLIGSGTVTVALDSDLFATQTGPATVLGTAPAVAEGWPNPLDTAGTWLQMTLSGSGAAVVNEVRHHVSFVRQTSNAR